MDIVNATSKRRVTEDLINSFDSKFFKTLSEPVRLQILRFLLLNGRSDIASIAENMPQDRSVISRHLNLMAEVGILSWQKETRHVFYEIDGQVFLKKLEKITDQIRKCIPVCCPTCMK